ncbi:cytochrome c [Halomonas korlensis]|uniref:Cytochrome C n=1 Tax=Halomonas korlensis TaxID=463301 RepID=A0A1I7GUH9_9GAMM|nr:cytochrome c [Halomonas korlensis]SFU52071.1 Cytochrome C' [Halomonas korlensis]
MLYTILIRSAPTHCGRGRRAVITLGTLVALGVSAVSLAAEPVRPGLTPKLQGLLMEEMIQIELAMQEVFSAIVQGRHTTVAEKGQSIHDSFILDQSMTDEDRQDLKAAVPAEFLQMDAYLHELSASLAEAGRTEDTPRQVELFGRMTESCVACHSTYVTDRFEGLETSDVPAEWGLGPLP